MTMPDKATADLLSHTHKIITEKLQWHTVSHYRSRLVAKVLVPELNEVLKLVASIGRTNYGFALFFENYPIRKLTKHYKHKKPNSEYVYGMHKHIWDEINRDQDCYIPNDIEPRW